MKVSIIIPTFNSQDFIAVTIDSVLSQTYRDIECIVVDGGSKDNTVSILKSYGDKITFVSERDKGVFDALNKGIKMAHGEIIGWLGSDDLYANDRVVEKAMQVMEEKKVDMCWGDLLYVHRDDTQKILRVWKSSPYVKGAFRRGWQVPHFASFIKKSVFERYGYFDLDFKIAGDYEMFLRFLEKNTLTTSYIPEVFVKMRSGGQSNRSVSNIVKANKECYRAWKVNGLKANPIKVFVPKLLGKVVQYAKAV